MPLSKSALAAALSAASKAQPSDATGEEVFERVADAIYTWILTSEVNVSAVVGQATGVMTGAGVAPVALTGVGKLQ